MNVRDRNVEDLSGGELQRFAIAMVCIQRGDMYVYHLCVFQNYLQLILIEPMECPSINNVDTYGDGRVKISCCKMHT